MRLSTMFAPIALMSASFVAAPLQSSAATPGVADRFVPAVGESAVRTLAQQLEDNFVFPDVGQRYAAALREKLGAGAYASFPSKAAFAEQVSADLAAIHKDGHLRVHVVPPEARSGPRGEQGGGPTGSALSRSGWIAPGVAYVAFDGFPGNEATLSATRAFIDSHAGAKTLIIDARDHRGGGLDEMDVLFPHLFARETVLVRMDTRVAVDRSGGGPVADGPTIRRLEGPPTVVRREHFVTPAAEPKLAGAKVYLLVSGKTASAGEHFALALKRTKRATLIGETTYGAGNFGGMTPLDQDFTYAAFVPVGRTFDPDTGDGWDGIGIAPDIAVPAIEALTEALVRSGVPRADARRLSAEHGPKLSG